MFCLQCGSQNPGNAVRCGACGALLEAVPAVLDQPFLRKAGSVWANVSPAARAVASVAIGVLGLSIMRTTVELSTSALVVFGGFAVAALGFYFGWASLQGARTWKSARWCRPAAYGGMTLCLGAALTPVVVMLGAIASIPERMVNEPLTLTNMRRLSVAMQSYAEDYNDRYPGWIVGLNGRAYHNVWDQQLFPYMKYNLMYHSGARGRGVRSPSQPSPRNRVITYGLNGLLITHPKPRFDGNADWTGGPASVSPGALNDPAETIVFAEIATDAPMEGIYRTVETPNTVAPGPRRRAVESRDYGRALVQWIDIDPRAWIETRGPKDSYIRGKWDAQRGVGRDLHSGGACYAFVDGHVEFKKLRQTVTGGRTGLSPDQFWTQENDGNMWNPYR